MLRKRQLTFECNLLMAVLMTTMMGKKNGSRPAVSTPSQADSASKNQEASSCSTVAGVGKLTIGLLSSGEMPPPEPDECSHHVTTNSPTSNLPTPGRTLLRVLSQTECAISPTHRLQLRSVLHQEFTDFSWIFFPLVKMFKCHEDHDHAVTWLKRRLTQKRRWRRR